MDNKNAAKNAIFSQIDSRTGEERSLEVPADEVSMVDVSDERIEEIARGYFVAGKHAIGRKADVRKLLEDKVVGRIGRKGKYLVDKLFELIDGVYMVDSVKKGPHGEDIRYYKQPPSLNAIVYAIDRVLGKPKQVNIQKSFSLYHLLVSADKRQGGIMPNGKFGRSYNSEISGQSGLLR